MKRERPRPEGAEPPPRPAPQRSLLPALGLALLTLALFLPALRHDFVTYDDPEYVTENPPVRAGLTWPGVAWAFRTCHADNWFPLTWLSHMADCQLYGVKPAGHHLTNALLHAANALLLFLLLRRLTGSHWRSLAVAALFAWHPLRVESVAWIAERKDVLSTFFGLLALWAYGESRKQKAESRNPNPDPTAAQTPSRFTFHVTRLYLLSLVFFACALMSKAMMVTLPFVMLLLDYWPLRRWQLKTPNSRPKTQDSRPKTLLPLLLEKLPFLVLSAIACVLTVCAQTNALATSHDLPLSVRAPHALVAYLHYVTATLAPLRLAVIYYYDPALPLSLIAGSAVVLGVISALALALARRAHYLIVGWLWYLGTLVPVIGLVQVGQQAWADRYTYLPGIGLAIMLVFGLSELLRPWPWRRAALSAAAALVLATCTLLTLRQLRSWHDSVTLYRHALQASTPTARTHFDLGDACLKLHQLPEAITQFREAVRLQPDWVHVLNNLAWLLATQPDPALRSGPEALRLASRADDLTGHTNINVLCTLAAACAEAGQYTNAIAVALQAEQLARATGDPRLIQPTAARVVLFRAGQPVREP